MSGTYSGAHRWRRMLARLRYVSGYDAMKCGMLIVVARNACSPTPMNSKSLRPLNNSGTTSMSDTPPTSSKSIAGDSMDALRCAASLTVACARPPPFTGWGRCVACGVRSMVGVEVARGLVWWLVGGRWVGMRARVGW